MQHDDETKRTIHCCEAKRSFPSLSWFDILYYIFNSVVKAAKREAGKEGRKRGEKE